MLTDEEIKELWASQDNYDIWCIEFARAIEKLVRERTIDECAGLFEHEFFAETKAAILALKEKK